MEKKLRKQHRKSREFLTYAGNSVFTLIMLIPFLFTLLLSVKNNSDILMNPLGIPEKLMFSNYAKAFHTLNPLLLFKNTFVIMLVTMAIEMVITFFSSVALTRIPFRNKGLQSKLYSFLLFGLAIPIYVLLFPIYQITIKLHLHGNFMSMVLPYIATSISFNTLLLTGFLRGFPEEVEEAAVIDGCSVWKICFQIIAPIIKPVLVTVFVFNVIYVWNEFPLAVTLISDHAKATISLGLSLFKSQYTIDYSGIIAGSIIIMAPQIIFFGFFQKYIVEGMTAGAVKG